jgi:hypothetical protein
MRKKFKLGIKYDEPTGNRRVYPKEVLEKAFKELIEGDFPGFISWDNPGIVQNLKNVGGEIESVDFSENPPTVIAKIFDTPGNLLKECVDWELFPNGTGKVDENNNVSEFKLISVNICCKPAK